MAVVKVRTFLDEAHKRDGVLISDWKMVGKVEVTVGDTKINLTAG